MADLVISNSNGRDIVILGKSFKPETNITTGSAAVLLKNLLVEKGIDVIDWDPFVDEDELKLLPNTPRCYFIGTKHDEFLDYNFEEGSVVIDPWRYIPESDKYKLISIGVGEGYEG